MNKGINYNQISLVPRIFSHLESRSEAKPLVSAFGQFFEPPIIASPMPDVCNGEMAFRLGQLGALGLIHRFQSVEQQGKEFSMTLGLNGTRDIPAGCAIGVTGDYLERMEYLYKKGCRIFCLDTANGMNIRTEIALKLIESFCNSCQDKIYIIAGNIATKEGYRYLSQFKVDAIRVGIAGGSVCTTKTETGVHVPMVTSILECVDERKRLATNATVARLMNKGAITNMEINKDIKNFPLIIADGGIKNPEDMCKALALGADFIMAGSIFAGTEEAPGKVISYNKQKVKLYRGAASFSVQHEFTSKEPDHNEGDESFVPYCGTVEKIFKRFLTGLKSSMSYMGAKDLEAYKENTEIINI